MSTPKPLTCLCDFEFANDKTRPYLMAEFAANGIRNLVLEELLVNEVMRNPNFADTLRRDAESAGIRFVDAHSPFGMLTDLNLPFEHARPAMIERQKLALRIIADLGLTDTTVHVGNTPDAFAEYSLDHLHECIIRSLDELLPLAEQLGVTIAIENIWFPTSTPEKLLDIKHRFDTDFLGLCYDSGHANLMRRERGLEESAPIGAWARFGTVAYDAEILEKMLPYITMCHLHDNNGARDEHILPGRGDIDWPHIVALLKTAPRLHSYQCEVIPVRTGTAIADVCKTMLAMFADDES